MRGGGSKWRGTYRKIELLHILVPNSAIDEKWALKIFCQTLLASADTYLETQLYARRGK
jgi:hypothetical protein